MPNQIDDMVAALDPASAAELRRRFNLDHPGTAALSHVVKDVATLPQRVMDEATSLQYGGSYNPGPAMETAMLMAGARLPTVKPGELGMFGGKPPSNKFMGSFEGGHSPKVVEITPVPGGYNVWAPGFPTEGVKTIEEAKAIADRFYSKEFGSPTDVINKSKNLALEGVVGPSAAWGPTKILLSHDAWIFPKEMFADIPREVQWKVPEKALAAGYRVPAHHGTRAPDFSEFKLPEELGKFGDEAELGIHFGSPRAAQRFAGRTVSGASDSQPRIYPVVLRAQNPLMMDDLGSWGASRVADYLGRTYPHVFSDKELYEAGGKGIQGIRDLIGSKGYDSAKYINDVEDKGHTSWIMMDPSRIRSPFAAFKDLESRDLLAGIGGTAAAPSIWDYVRALQGEQRQ